MQVSELLDFVKWFDHHVVKNQVPQHCQNLFNVLNSNVNRQNNQPIQPFSQQKDSLINSMIACDTKSLTIEQNRLLEKLKLAGKLGEEGESLIEGILFKNNLDLAQARQEIQNIHTTFSSAVSKVNQLKQGLIGTLGEEDFYDLKNQVLMRIYFKGERQIKNLQDFKKMGDAWFEIGYGITLAHGGSIEDISIVGAQKGSVIFDIVLIAKYAATISGILLGALKITEKVLDILKKGAELKQLGLKNQLIIKELEKEAESTKTEGIKKIVAETIEELGIKPKKEGDKVNALEKSINRLIEFTKNGGEIDFVSHEEEVENTDEQEEDNEKGAEKPNLIKVRENFIQIREIETKLRLIEYQLPKEDSENIDQNKDV